MDALNFNADSPAHSEELAPQLLIVPRGDRWQIYHRLQELEVACRCSTDGLEVTAHGFTAQVQVWSVVHRLRASRSQLVNLLERSWLASA